MKVMLRKASAMVLTLPLTVALATALASCSPGASVQLQPDKKADTGSPTDGQKPGTPDIPTPPPQTTPASYRVFCEYDDGSGDSLLMMTSSRANASSVNTELAITDRAVDKSSLSGFRAIAPVASFGATASSRAGLRSLVLFEAAGKKQDGTPLPRAVYLAELNLAMASGSALAVGGAMALDAGATAAAAKLGLELRNHGASSRGKFLVLPQSKNFSIVRAADLQTVGQIDLPPQTTFFPQIDEETGVFSAWQWSGGRFADVALLLDLATDAVAVKSSLSLPVPTANLSALPVQTWPNGLLAWAEIAGSGTATQAELVVFDPSSGSVQSRSVYAAPQGAQIAPWISVAEIGAQPAMFVLAVEKIGGAPLKVSQASLVGVVPQGTGVATLFDVNYPVDVVTEIESHGRSSLGGSLAIGAMASSRDRRALFATLPRLGAPMVYKLVEISGGFQLQAAGRSACYAPAILKEEL